MARWTDLAPRQEHTANQGGPMSEHRGVVLHIADGSYEGTISWQKNTSSDVSSHFIVDTNGTVCQMVDTDTTAWTQKAGNGHWLSIENAGHTPSALTAAQVEAAAQLLARAHKDYGVPLQVTSDPDGRGLGHHSMGAHPGYPDDWGHSACPGKAIIDQKPAIVERAKEIVGGGSMPVGLIGLEKGMSSSKNGSDVGDAIKSLQLMLRSAGHYSGDPTGVFDDATVKAVLKCRQAEGSSVTDPADADRIDSWTYTQVLQAFIKSRVPKGDPGPAGPGIEPGTELELAGSTVTVTKVTPPA